MLKSDIHVVVRILQPCIDGANTLDVVGFAKKYDRELRNAGLMLKYLGLATESSKSAFGWRPSRVLLKKIVERQSQVPCDVPPCDEDADDFTRELMVEDIYGRTPPLEENCFGFKLLCAAGLMHNDGFWTITDELAKLFQQGWYRKRNIR